MKERPILFSAPMVRAILDGSKTQTRRIVKPQPPRCLVDEDENGWYYQVPIVERGFTFMDRAGHTPCPFGRRGSQLWVRETFNRLWFNAADGWQTVYRADAQNDGPIDGSADSESSNWKPSIHMPRSHSRIMLEVTGVKVERVQDISEEDAWAEGVSSIARTLPYSGDDLGRVAFSGLWEGIYAARGFPWESNPWVWCVSFKRNAL